ncbi:MAG: type II secretion system F family protein [Anaerolineales bacterium]|nr:type II secretion system F family protein [Anaerolineales bacterium]
MNTQRQHKSRTLLLSASGIALSTLLGWVFRDPLARFAESHPAFYPAAIVFIAFLLIALSVILWVEAEHLRRVWRSRVAREVGLSDLAPEPVWRSILGRLPDPLEWIMRPVWRTSLGNALRQDWIDAELGEKASRYGFLLFLAALAGYFIGSRIGGPLLGAALGFVVPLLPRALVSNRAATRRRRFSEQLPQALDAIASGLAAGLSFQQAVEYAEDDLPEPVKSAIATLARRIKLAFPVDQALQKILEIYPDEALALVVDGLVLQRKFGGDMVRMLEDIAGVLRERLELEREVRAITTQGRLSGIIIAALVPVSAGFLLSFNPRYVDVLFDTLIGQILVVLAIILQLVGWAIISRLVQIRY